MAGSVNVQVTIDAKDQGAAATLLKIKELAGQMGLAFNVATSSSEKLGASGLKLGRDFSGAFAGAIEGATGLRTVLAQVALGYEAIHAARAFLTEGFGATSTIEQAKLGAGAETAAATTVTDPSGKAIEGQEKLALATALSTGEMEKLEAAAAKVGITAEQIAPIFTDAIRPAIEGSRKPVAETLASLSRESLAFAELGRRLKVPYEDVQRTLLQILNGQAQRRNLLVVELGLTQAQVTAAHEQGRVQDLLNEKLKKFGDLGADAASNLKGVGGIIAAQMEEGAEKAVAPIVAVIEQKIGPALGKLDLSGLTRAIQSITTQLGTALGSMFDSAVKGAEDLASWLDQNREKVQAAASQALDLAKEIGSAVAEAGKLAAEFVKVGLSSGVFAGAVREIAALLPAFAAIWAVDKAVNLATTLTTLSGAAIGAARSIAGIGSRVAGMAGAVADALPSINLFGNSLHSIAVARLAEPLEAATPAIAGAGVAAEGAAIGFISLNAAVAGIGLVLAGIGLAWEAYRSRQEQARLEQQAANQALGETIRLAPDLISQLAAEEQAARSTAAGTTARKEAEEAVAATKAKLIALSPDYKGALSDETSSIEQQTAALEKLVATEQQQAADRVRAARERVAGAEANLERAKTQQNGPAEIVGGAIGGALGPAGVDIGVQAGRAAEIAQRKAELEQAKDDLQKAQADLAPPAAGPSQTIKQVQDQMAADTAIVRAKHKAHEDGLGEEKAYQSALAQIQFDGLQKQIAIRQQQERLETDPYRKDQIEKQIADLRRQQGGFTKFTPTPGEAAPGKGDKGAQELREAEAEGQRRLSAEQMAADKQATEDLYKEKLLTAEQYYTKLAAIEYDGYQKEVAIDEQLLATETDPKKRTELLAQITILNEKSLEATKHTTAEEITALDELQRKRVETARTSISEGEAGVRDTLSARVEDTHAQVDVGTVTKAQGAQQLASAYSEALTNLRALYAEAVAFAQVTGDPKDAIEVEKIATAYAKVQSEAEKATQASNELGKDLGDALEHAFESAFGGGIDKMRSFSEAIRQMALGIAKDLQHALSEPIGKNIKTSVEKLFAPKVPAADKEPIGASAGKLDAAGQQMSAAAAQWKQVADQFARLGLPAGSAPSSARTAEAPAAQRGNVTQGGVGTVSPEGETIAPPGAPIAPTLGVLGGDAGLGALPVDAAPTQDGSPQYQGGSGGPSGALKSETGITGIASQVTALIPGAGGLSKALGLANQIGTGAEKVAASGNTVASVAGALGGGGGSGPGALSGAAAALRSVATALGSSATQLGQSAQQLTQAASALSSGGSGGGAGGGGISSILGMFSGGGGDAADAGAALMVSGGGQIVRMAAGGAADVKYRRHAPPILKAAAGLFALHLAMGGPAKAESPAAGWAARLAPAVHAFARGGPVWGAGTATSDSIPAMLSHGEYVVKAASVAKVGVPTMHAINAGSFTRDSHNSIRTFATGGLVSGGPANSARGSEHHVVEVRPPEGWVAKEMESPEAQNAHVRISTRNARSIKAGLGIG